MPNVVVDTSVSLPATLSPGGARRKLWVVLAVGAVTFEVEHGSSSSTRSVHRPTRRAAPSSERLPYGTPDDWVAVGSRSLFDEYERKLREVGGRLDPHLREEDVPLLRRQMEAVCVIGAPLFMDSAVPTLTADPKDDPILYTALLADADLLISSDKHLVPDRKEELWEHEAGTVLARTFETLLADRLSGVDWDGIDGSWLGLAYDEAE